MKRRRLLTSTGLIFAGMVAGCSGETERSGPTDTVENYFDALSDGDRETANQFAHPDGDFHLDDDSFQRAQNLTITETETVDMEEAVREMFANPAEVNIDEVVAEEEVAVEEVQNQYGFTEFAYVRHDATADNISFNSVYLLFEGEDGWVIWSLPTSIIAAK